MRFAAVHPAADSRRTLRNISPLAPHSDLVPDFSQLPSIFLSRVAWLCLQRLPSDDDEYDDDSDLNFYCYIGVFFQDGFTGSAWVI